MDISIFRKLCWNRLLLVMKYQISNNCRNEKILSLSLSPRWRKWCKYIFSPLQYHHMSSQTSWSPPRLWLKWNRLLRLGRPVGAVTLSRWEWWWDEWWIWGARGGALNLISTKYPDHGHHGRLPLSKKNAYGRAGNFFFNTFLYFPFVIVHK